ncbi:MAG: nicotinate-nucleotide--dimethylbenzimidazole phosphoribosyltransferase [Armatimonadetes bacterium]|nr:nicotinate-nucleotide--dimethylbenzimidazole phosphoribosyltransferase [Armatimonadota bacterium]
MEALPSIAPLDEAVLAEAALRQDRLIKPPGSLGVLEDLANRIAAVRGRVSPPVARMRLFVAAADHGVVEEGVSRWPSEVTAQMVGGYCRGQAAVNVLARQGGIDLRVVDAGLATDLPPDGPVLVRKQGRGTANMVLGPAMSAAEVAQTVQDGFDLALEAARDGVDMLGIGEMGIGNSTAAAAITSVLTGRAPREVTGRGAGLDAAGVAHKVAVIERALRVNAARTDTPLGLLASVGGAEIALLCGVALGAARARVPLVLDGFIATAAAAVAARLCPRAREAMFLGHLSAEPGHAALAEHLGLDPVLRLDMRLGEGSGAALAMPVLRSASCLLAEMATFEEAGVAQADEGQEISR